MHGVINAGMLLLLLWLNSSKLKRAAAGNKLLWRLSQRRLHPLVSRGPDSWSLLT